MYCCSFPLLVAMFCLAGSTHGQSVHRQVSVDVEPCVKHLDGCSIPLGLPFPYKEFFEKACFKHDVCYRCGKIYNWTQKECDKAFEANMNTLCILWDQGANSNSFSSWNIFDRLKAVFTVAKDLAKWMTIKCKTLDHCLQASRVYYSSVDGFGGGHYGSNHAACSLKCAKPYGAPGNLI